MHRQRLDHIDLRGYHLREREDRSAPEGLITAPTGADMDEAGKVWSADIAQKGGSDDGRTGGTSNADGA